MAGGGRSDCGWVSDGRGTGRRERGRAGARRASGGSLRRTGLEVGSAATDPATEAVVAGTAMATLPAGMVRTSMGGRPRILAGTEPSAAPDSSDEAWVMGTTMTVGQVMVVGMTGASAVRATICGKNGVVWATSCAVTALETASVGVCEPAARGAGNNTTGVAGLAGAAADATAVAAADAMAAVAGKTCTVGTAVAVTGGVAGGVDGASVLLSASAGFI